MFLYCKFLIVDNFNVKKRLKFNYYYYICIFKFCKKFEGFVMEIAKSYKMKNKNN